MKAPHVVEVVLDALYPPVVVAGLDRVLVEKQRVCTNTKVNNKFRDAASSYF